MPRPKTQSDEHVLDAALTLMHQGGPEALTFARLADRSGLSGATLVQRFGNKAKLRQAALLHAWDRLDDKTIALAAAAPGTPEGAIAILVGLSGDYGGIESYAEGLLVLREDLRDPVLRARGAAWEKVLTAALDACFSQVRGIAPGIGLLAATHWQGALLWWSFNPQRPVEDHVEESLKRFLAVLMAPGGRHGG